jgi:hypothetical protein
MDMVEKGMYEWWYFDAHLDNGYTIVVFFHAANPNPDLQQLPCLAEAYQSRTGSADVL